MQFACALNPKWPHRALSLSDTSLYIVYYSYIFRESHTAHRERSLALLYAQRAHILSRTARFTDHLGFLTARPRMFVKPYML